VRPLLRRDRPVDATTMTIRWDRDRSIAAWPGDTVSTALFAAGVLATGTSLKFRRPRGPYCLGGDCGTCLVRIDGVPNLRACATAVRPGMHVEPQNRVVDVGPDPTRLVDTVFARGMDHHHLMVRPRLANLVMQEVARNLAGLGTLPDAAPDMPAECTEERVAVLVIGAGAAGRAAAAACRSAGVQVLVVDRRDAIALAADGVGSDVQASTAVFGAYAREGLWAAVAQRTGAAAALRVIEPRHVVIATGARDPMLLLRGNDLPGVVAARGLVAQLRRSGAAAAATVVVIGDGEPATSCARALAAERVAVDDVVEIVGGSHVEGVRLRDRTIACGLVALAAPPAPAFELARQAGAELRWDGGGFAVVRDGTGRCAVAGKSPWTLWACGDVCGYIGPAAAASDGSRIGRAIADAEREPP
jgi:sarcosine oxidase subunit alpha